MTVRNPLDPRRNSVTWVLPIMPVLLIGAVLQVMLHVRLGLGHWPKPMWEDYQTNLYTIHLHAVLLLFIIVLAALPMWGVMLFFSRLRMSWKTHLLQAACYAGGWSLLGLFVKWDPFRFFAWLAD